MAAGTLIFGTPDLFCFLPECPVVFICSSSSNHVQVLVDLGLLNEQELEDSIASEFNPVHIGFHSKNQGPDIVAEDVLNLGVSPK